MVLRSLLTTCGILSFSFSCSSSFLLPLHRIYQVNWSVGYLLVSQLGSFNTINKQSRFQTSQRNNNFFLCSLGLGKRGKDPSAKGVKETEFHSQSKNFELIVTGMTSTSFSSVSASSGLSSEEEDRSGCCSGLMDIKDDHKFQEGLQDMRTTKNEAKTENEKGEENEGVAKSDKNGFNHSSSSSSSSSSSFSRNSKYIVPSWVSKVNRALGRSGRDPTCKYVQLATVSYNEETNEAEPNVRTVVFRGFMDGSKSNILKFITDQRSAKVNQIQRNHHGEIAWYITKTREQFRIKGNLVIVGELLEETNNKIDDIEPITGFSYRYLQGKRREQWNNLSDNAKLQFWWPHPGNIQDPNIDPSIFSAPPSLIPPAESIDITSKEETSNNNKENSSPSQEQEENEETLKEMLEESGVKPQKGKESKPSKVKVEVDIPSLPPSTFKLLLFNPYFVDYLDLRANPQCRIQSRFEFKASSVSSTGEKGKKYADPCNPLSPEEDHLACNTSWNEEQVNP